MKTKGEWAEGKEKVIQKARRKLAESRGRRQGECGRQT